MPRLFLTVIFATTGLSQTNEIRVLPVVSGLSRPTDIQNAGDGSGRLFVAQQNGIIRLLKNGVLATSPFLDISAKVAGAIDCGLLGLAFPPAFPAKRYFYVHYTSANCQTSTIARYRLSANPDAADAASEQVVLTQSMPSGHNGGQIAFGKDGFLYVAFGDGGGVADPNNFGQNRQTLLGKLLRIDTETSTTYSVPPGNPFTNDATYRPEIWALGLRNPWRFSFDRLTGDLWIADVGENRAEEINFQPASSNGGQNYGWRLKEGLACNIPPTGCEQPGLTDPVHEYGRASGDHSVTGGFVYRGARIPALAGDYVYGDFVSGRIWALRRNGPSFLNREMLDTSMLISTFGQDESGEIYVASFLEGAVYLVDGLAGAFGPTIIDPSPGLTIPVSGVGFRWTMVPAATGYNMRITRAGAVIFQGDLAGAATLNTLVSLDDGDYQFHVRACTGGFGDAQCGAFSSVAFRVQLDRPTNGPVITAPVNGQVFTSSTQQFAWNPLAGATRYEMLLRDMAAAGKTVLSTANAGNPPATSTIFSMPSSTSYRLEVRGCTSACGPWSAPVDFGVSLPPVPTLAPSAPSCGLSGGNVVQCSWNAVPGADLYILEGVSATGGPGGGALTVASVRVPETNAMVVAPQGSLGWFVRACNGNGCGPASAPTGLNPTGPNSSAPRLGTPVSGATLDGPGVVFSWSRIPGDNGSNTVYRLFVQDFSRTATAADVLTTQNFWPIQFRGGGNRYDALVVANPGAPAQVIGPATGFVVNGNSPASPTLVAPRHQSPEVTHAVAAGNLLLAWTPIPGTGLYEYFVAVQGQPQATARGVTPGLFVQVPLAASGIPYSGIVRACPSGAICTPGSDTNWGPWSNAPGGSGVTNFLVQ